MNPNQCVLSLSLSRLLRVVETYKRSFPIGYKQTLSSRAAPPVRTLSLPSEGSPCLLEGELLPQVSDQ